MLASEYNRRRLGQGVLDLARERMRRAYGRRRRIIVDVDSYAHETYGNQDGTAYNGHYRVEGYHPLAAFTDTGDIVGVMLRPGNVHTAEDVRQFLSPIIDTLKQDCDELVIRMDAGYAAGKLLAWLAKRGVRFLTRLPNNSALKKKVAKWETKTLKSWAANPTEDGLARHATREFWHRAKGWTSVVRVVAVTVERDTKRGELFHHTFFLATNYARPQATSEAILQSYRKRAVAETRIGELTRVIAPKLSSAQRHRNGAPHRKRKVGMAENEVTLLLAAIAYQLVHTLRCLLEGATGQGFSLDRVRERVLKVAASVVRHARAVHFRIASTKADLWRMLAGTLATFRADAGVAA